MQDDNFVFCPVCNTETIVHVISETPVMFMPTGVGVLPGCIATPHDAHIFKCSNPGCSRLFHDSLGDHLIIEQLST